jgi:DNA-binding MarR family transcriptional regulator
MDESFFVNTKPVKTMVALLDKDRTWYASLLAKEVDCTYAHMVNILDELASAGLVVFKREGRIKFVSLSDEGEEIAGEFTGVLRRLEKFSESE